MEIILHPVEKKVQRELVEFFGQRVVRMNTPKMFVVRDLDIQETNFIKAYFDSCTVSINQEVC